MSVRFFRNRWYRAYFELVDAFRGSRCPLCHLLLRKERVMVTSLVSPSNQQKKGGISLKTLCIVHRARVREVLGNEPSLLPLLKTVVGMSLRELAHPPKTPASGWGLWLRGRFVRCPLCDQLFSQERALCQALIQFLDDVEFWREFQKAPLLCLDHVDKSLALTGRCRGAERFVADQSAKLNALLNGLVRFEIMGANGECRVTALDWLAEFVGPTVNPAGPARLVPSSENNVATELLSEGHADRTADESPDEEKLLFENEKLRRKIHDLIDRLNKVEARAASLHYRAAESSEVNKRLEMGYTGASTQARYLEQLVRDLREEIKKLKEGGAENRSPAPL